EETRGRPRFNSELRVLSLGIQHSQLKTEEAGLMARIPEWGLIPARTRHHSRAAVARGAAGAGGRATRAGVGDGPLHIGHYEHRGVVDSATAAARTAAAAAIDLIAVVFVVRHPIDVIEGAVVVFQGVVIVVPELLQTLFFTRQALVALGEDVP